MSDLKYIKEYINSHYINDHIINYYYVNYHNINEYDINEFNIDNHHIKENCTDDHNINIINDNRTNDHCINYRYNHEHIIDEECSIDEIDDFDDELELINEYVLYINNKYLNILEYDDGSFEIISYVDISSKRNSNIEEDGTMYILN